MRNIFKFFHFFYRFGTGYIYSEWILIALLLASSVPLYISMIFFKNVNRLPKSACVFTSFIYDIIKPIIYLWGASELCRFMARILDGRFGIDLAAFLLIALVWGVDIYIYLTIIVPEMKFTPGRSFSWNSMTMWGIMTCIWGSLCVTQLVEAQVWQIATLTICFIWCILCFLFVQYTEPCIIAPQNSCFKAGLSTGFLTLILQTIRLYIPGISELIVVLAFICSYLLFIFLFFYLDRQTALVRLAWLQNYQRPQIDNKHQLLKTLRTGFVNGDPYTLSWDPFVSGLERWETYVELWTDYLRFLSVYVEYTNELITAFVAMRLQHFSNPQTRRFKQDVQRAIYSRDHTMTPKIKNALANIETKVRVIKNRMSSYWTSVEEGQINLTYDIASVVRKQFIEVDSEFQHLVSAYQNNSTVCLRYAQFLRDVAVDPRSSLVWQLRGEQLKGGMKMADDFETAAHEMFPLLPRGESRLESALSSRPDFDSITDNSATAPQIEEIDQSPSMYRELGLNHRLMFVTVPIYLAAIAYTFCFIIGSYLPLVLVVTEISSYRAHYKFLKYACGVNEAQTRLMTLLTQTTFRLDDRYPDPDEEKAILGITENGYYDTVESLKYMDETIQLLGQMMGRDISYDTNAGKYFQESNLLTKLTTLAGYLHHYSVNDAAFDQEDWYLNALELSTEIRHHIVELTYILSDFMARFFSNTSEILAIVFGVFTSFVFPLFLYMISLVKKKYVVIILTLSRLPHVALQKAKSRFSGTRIEERSLKEERHLSTFTQLDTNRGSNGLPLVSLSIACLCDYISAMVTYIIIMFIVPTYTKTLCQLPYRQSIFSNVMVTCYSAGTAMLRQYAGVDVGTLVTDETAKLDSALSDFLYSRMSGQSVGIMTAPSYVTDEWFDVFHEEWLSQPNMHDRLILMPRDMMVSYLYEILIYAQRTSSLELIVLFGHITSYHLNNISTKMTNDYSDEVNSRIPNALTTMFLISTAFVALGLFVLIVLMSIFSSLRSVIRFILSTIGMIRKHYIDEANNVLSMLFGKFGEDAKCRPEEEAMKCIEDELDDALVVLDEAMHVKAINTIARSTFGEPGDVHYSLYLSISDELTPGVEMTTRVNDIPCRMMVENVDGLTVLIMKMHDILEEKDEELELARERLRCLQLCGVPMSITENIQNAIRYVAKNIVIMVIKSVDSYPCIDKGEVIRTVGRLTYVVYNLDGELSNPEDAALEEANGFYGSIGLAKCDEAIIGLISKNTVEFDIFTDEMNTATILALNAAEGQGLSTYKRKGMTKVEIGTITAYSFDIVDQMLEE